MSCARSCAISAACASTRDDDAAMGDRVLCKNSRPVQKRLHRCHSAMTPPLPPATSTATTSSHSRYHATHNTTQFHLGVTLVRKARNDIDDRTDGDDVGG